MTTVMEITPTSGNSGLPKWNGVTMANSGSSPTPEKSSRPAGQHSRTPATAAMSRDALATMPRARTLSPKAMTTTMAAIPMYSGRA